jgi:tetratricopeptide (TPR) repeat protein
MSRLFAFGVAVVAAVPLFAQPPTPGWQAYQSGQAALAREDFAGAERQFRIAIKEDRLLSLAHYGLGTTLGATRRYPEALESFKQAIATHRERLAQQHVQAAKLDQARDQEIQELRDSLRNIGAQKFASAHAGTLLEQRIQQLEREKGREKAALMQQPPVPVEFFVALGGAHARLEQVAEAKAAFAEALKIDSKRGDVHHNLAVLAVAQGDKATAQEHIRLAESFGFRVGPDLKTDAGMDASAVAAAPVAPAPAPQSAALSGALLTIQHEALTCALVGRSPLLEARVVGPDAPAQVRVRFSVPGSAYQYSIRLKADGGRYVTRLPKPKAGLASFTYTIDATDKGAGSARTDEVTVPVAATPQECPGVAPAARETLLVEIPESAPARPPVPDGFSEDGVKGTGGTKVGMTNVPAKLGAAVGVVGVVAGAAFARGSLYDQEPSTPDPVQTQIEMIALDPPAGSTIVSPSQVVHATFRVSVSRDVQRTMLRVRLRDSRGVGCIEIAGVHGPSESGATLEMTASGAAQTLPSCRPPFDVLGLGVDVQADTEFVVFNQSFPATYKVVTAPPPGS